MTNAEAAGPARDLDEHDALRFSCPRCGGDVEARFYGPCDGCRSALRLAYAGEGRDVVAPAYEPKMNVTPNAVALKD